MKLKEERESERKIGGGEGKKGKKRRKKEGRVGLECFLLPRLNGVILILR